MKPLPEGVARGAAHTVSQVFAFQEGKVGTENKKRNQFQSGTAATKSCRCCGTLQLLLPQGLSDLPECLGHAHQDAFAHLAHPRGALALEIALSLLLSAGFTT